ncbi:MAG: 2Fe-2S iron-sulfur cluster-binding protein [Candidatus Micrarchaeota archaeon]
MPKLTIKPDNSTIEVPKGKNLREVCEENNLSITFSCKEGNCGTCLSQITKGLENLTPKTETEKKTLAGIPFKNNYRLICQCKMKGPGNVEIKKGVQ